MDLNSSHIAKIQPQELMETILEIGGAYHAGTHEILVEKKRTLFGKPHLLSFPGIGEKGEWLDWDHNPKDLVPPSINLFFNIGLLADAREVQYVLENAFYRKKTLKATVNIYGEEADARRRGDKSFRPKRIKMHAQDRDEDGNMIIRVKEIKSPCTRAREAWSHTKASVRAHPWRTAAGGSMLATIFDLLTRTLGLIDAILKLAGQAR